MSARDEPRPERAIARSLGVIHNIAYYSREVRDFEQLGLPQFWRAYVAWRCAPLGAVGPQAATAVLYNFAPRMVADALPSAWETTTPAEVLAMRDDMLSRALVRGLGDLAHSAEVRAAADLARAGIDGTDVAGRALFAAHADLDWPDEPWMQLWHATTLWREHRGDGHNIALAAAGIDGLEAHVLLAARGVADQPTIEKIRGWTTDEWGGAVIRLADRGLVTADGGATPEGTELRQEIERRTDDLAAEPRARLGPERLQQLIDLASPLAGHLVEVGAVAGRWPPPNPVARDS